ncbi:penicillin acylase family protein [Mucilaginibacter myungsuensis]|uniref:Penicillin acylase family protein n=1 Tax=Mucilaginibacter myungsuensis TaxID=649104 RepID=A0A929PVV0_9SPHI|nr:penicillin acylase family protein [Mucilaginibacter myungsuensis]MBE9660695.1 penicillin acylase family protein [Mucilaginibacter myungsuensis]MDN3600740.1 penicillin acylase family protein [Mucilaginibacter myungsuensis]
MRATKAIISVLATAALIVGLEVKWSADIPAIAPFLNPANGFWQNGDSKHIIKQRELKLDGLQGKVIIRYDEHMIPHIFAGNDHDLYYAQGYVTATDRLWQMDIQTRSASGRLAEVVGPKALGIDRHHRRMGMVYGAEKSINEMMKDPKLEVMIQAYTDGINAYIHSLWPRDYPLEFKLLGYKPEAWKPIDCAFLLKQMTETLAGGTQSPEMTNVLRKFGPDTTKDLFPDYPFREDPIIPEDTKWDFQALPLPKASADLLTTLVSPIDPQPKVEGLGSNNWAIAGSKTKSGYPILANDPHLNLTLPSIWFQVQLHAPGINVNGVSIPGAPGVIIGYNDKVSWGVTNVDADVLDYYQIKFRDSSRNEYWYKNKWNNTTKRVERIDVRNAETLFDTVVYTHHGPVVYETLAQRPEFKNNVPVACAVRWIAHERSKDLLAFYLLNRAQNYDDYRTALSQYSGPAQNFIFASADKDIAITVNGKFPLKYKDQGKFILDGSNPNDDWHGWIPFEQNPTAKNPARGFLSSANQSSTDTKYPYYLNWSFVPYERGKRINERLRVMTDATVDSMRSIQNDNYSIMAQDALPMMLDLLGKTNLNADQQIVLNHLKKWNKYYDANSLGASIFDTWWHKFYGMIWDDEFGGDGLVPPSRDRTVKLLLGEHSSKWIDNIKTPERETLPMLIVNSYKAAVDQLYKNHGKPGEAWEWGRVKSTYINHLGNVPGMGLGNFIAGGYGSSVNALIDGHGPSWRMVVQMGPTVQGYGILPGGQSGNPGSVYFNDMLPTWQAGQLQPLVFLHSATESSKRIVSTLTLSSK